MKTFSNFAWRLSAILFVCLQSCGTSTTQLRVLQPAQLKISDHINTIAVIDRSRPSSGFIDVIASAATGTEMGQSRSGRRKALAGLTDALTKTPRFNVKSTDVEMMGSESGRSYMPPLDWYEIEGICQKYQTDAVAAIEMFDPDIKISTVRSDVKSKDKDGKETVKPNFNATRRISITIGWRLYDPQTKIIIDEFRTTQSAESQGSGPSEREAIKNLASS